jgi:hypothetical protein
MMGEMKKKLSETMIKSKKGFGTSELRNSNLKSKK